MSLLITATDLAALLTEEAGAARDAGVATDQQRTRVLDVRWRLDRPDGRPEYLAGHIPGAVYVDLDTQLAAHGEPTDGRHPLPPVALLQAAARSWGINPGDRVVVYDDLKNLSSARAWWLLRYAGFDDVRVLDGSLRAWTAAGFDLAVGDERPEPGGVTLDYGHLPVLTIDEAARVPTTGALLDSRAPERYRGDVEPIDPRAGHIPGALNVPSTVNLTADGYFLPADTLREQFIAAGVPKTGPVATYCGSGVVASHNALALTLAGFTPSVFPGSWSQWSNQSERPVAVGDTPFGIVN